MLVYAIAGVASVTVYPSGISLLLREYITTCTVSRETFLRKQYMLFWLRKNNTI